MSITPLHPQGMPPLSPDPQPGGLREDKIIRRWLWRQTGNFFRAALFVGLGMLLGLLLAARYFAPQFENELRASYEQQRQAELAEQRRYATILLEPSGAEKMVVGALGWLVGIPGAGEAVLGGLPGSDAKWVLSGKHKPMSNAPNTAFAWVNLETKATEGPFKPEAVK